MVKRAAKATDFGAPERPLNAWMKFVVKHKTTIDKKVQKKIDAGEITGKEKLAEGAKEAKELLKNAAHKAEYEKMEGEYKAAMEKYNKTMDQWRATPKHAEYQAALKGAQVKKTAEKKKKANKDEKVWIEEKIGSKAPPKGAYMLFSQEYRNSTAGAAALKPLKVTEQGAHIGALYKALSDAEKDKLTAKSQKLTAEYAVKIEAVKKSAEYKAKFGGAKSGMKSASGRKGKAAEESSETSSE